MYLLFFYTLLYLPKIFDIVRAAGYQVGQHLLDDSGNAESAKWGFDVSKCL